MKIVVLLLVFMLIAGGFLGMSQCSSDDPAERIQTPVERSRDTVDQLNEQQRQREQQYGGDE